MPCSAILFKPCSETCWSSNVLWSFRNDKLTKEKLEIQKQFEAFQREVKHTSKANTAKEIRVLKKVVQNLEVRKNSNKLSTVYRWILKCFCKLSIAMYSVILTIQLLFLSFLTEGKTRFCYLTKSDKQLGWTRFLYHTCIGMNCSGLRRIGSQFVTYQCFFL